MPKPLVYINKIFLVVQDSVVAYGFCVAFPTDLKRAAVQLIPLVILPLTLFAHSKQTKGAIVSALLANASFCAAALWVLFFSIDPGMVSARVVLIVFTAIFLRIPFIFSKKCELQLSRMPVDYGLRSGGSLSLS